MGTQLLNRAIRWYLGEHAPGEGVSWKLSVNWSLAPWLTLLVVLALVGMIGYQYRREVAPRGRRFRTLLAGLRLAALGLLLLMLSEMVLTLQRTGLPSLTVLIDDSASMTVRDPIPDAAPSAAPVPSRMEWIKSYLTGPQRPLEELARRYRLHVATLGTGIQPLSGNGEELTARVQTLTGSGTESQLGSGLRGTLLQQRGDLPSAVVLLTDGAITSGLDWEQAGALAAERGVPVFVVGVGQNVSAPSVELSDLLVDDVVFPNDLIDFRAKLRAKGMTGQTLEVSLRERGQREVLARQQLVANEEGQSQAINLPYRPTVPGDHEYVISVESTRSTSAEPLAELSKTIMVREEKIRVLLVHGYPNYEYRYLKHMLQRDSTIQLNTVLLEADLDYAREDPIALRLLPSRREELMRYDVIILGDVNPAQVSPSVQESLVQFVEKKGGGLICIAGERYLPLAFRGAPLAELFPIDLSTVQLPPPSSLADHPFTARPTDQGLAIPALQLGDSTAESRRLWEQLADLYWMLTATPLPTAQVLAEHPQRTLSDGRKAPVILLQYVGSGKVVFHATDETWRWRYRVGDVYFSRYWIQTIRYLSRGKLLGTDRSTEITLDQKEYPLGTSPHVRVRFFDDRRVPTADDGVQLLLERSRSGGKTVTLRRHPTERQIFEATLESLEAGSYRLLLVEPSPGKTPIAAEFQVLPPAGEMQHVELNREALVQLAHATQGKFYSQAEADQLWQDLPSGKRVPIEPLPPLPLWNQWWLLVPFLGLLVLEWSLRKWAGMV